MEQCSDECLFSDVLMVLLFNLKKKNLIEVHCVCLARPSGFAESFKKRGEFLCVHLA